MKKLVSIILSLLVLSFHVSSFVLAEDIFSEDAVVEPEIVPEEVVSDELPEEIPAEPEPEPEPEPVELPLIYINEILADPSEDDAANEFIEIYNAGHDTLDLRGWRLCDARGEDGSYYFTNENLSYLIEPGAFLSLFRPETGITLNNDTDSVTLFDAEGRVVDTYEFLSSDVGKSWGRNPDELGQWLVFKTPTPGTVNIVEPNQPPVAVIEVQKDTRHMKLNVTGANSVDPDGDKLSFLWEFEEGVFDERENPLIYEYATPGEKLIRLKVTDTYGDSGEAEIIFDAILNLESDVPEPEPVELPLIYINEILADPSEDDAANEFIELFNAGTEPVDLRNWKLDDARADDGAYPFTGNELDYLLEPGAYRVFFRPETGITLNNDTDSVTLFDAEGRVVDAYEFLSSDVGKSWGRHPDELGQWLVFKTPTPGTVNIVEPNQPPVAVIEVQKDTRYLKLNVTGANSVDPDGDKLSFLWEFEEGVFDERENPLIYEYATPGEKTVRLTVTDPFGESGRAEFVFSAMPVALAGGSSAVTYPKLSLINEFMPDPAGKDSENEWIELFNGSSVTADLSGWYLDDADGNSRPFKIPAGTRIASNSFLVFAEPELGLSLKNSEDMVRLLDPNKKVSQEVSYVGAKENWTYARLPSGHFEWTPLFTPEAINEFPPPPKTYPAKSVIFESILPNPEGPDAGNEKMVLTSRFFEDIDLSDWSVMDASGAKKSLSNVFLPVEQSITLSSADFKLSLNNSDESLSLFDPTDRLIDYIQWKSSASGRWLFNPDSLESGLLGNVVRVIDGDTFVLQSEDKYLTVRLIGVDTPETVHPFKAVEYYGKQASAFLSSRLTDQQVMLEFDENKIDKYGRVLAYVYLGDSMINREVISQGYGFAYTRYPFLYMDEFITLQAEAMEAGLGLWQNQKVKYLIEQLINDELLLEEDFFEEDILLMFDEDLPEELDKEELIDENASERVMNVSTVQCDSDFLKIDSFMPNPQKEKAIEYIKLVNTGSEKVCLLGWSLDDDIGKGSKPFYIKGGSIAPGGVRTFRKQETKLALNNSNDCVNLIAPSGQLADSICYEKTHKNEIFTHAGGDWQPKPKAKKQSKSAQKTLRHSFKREFISYRSDLPAIHYIGRVMMTDDERKVLVMRLENGQMIDVSYAGAPFNVAVIQETIDLNEILEIQVYETPQVKKLLAIRPLENDFATFVLAPVSDVLQIMMLFFVIIPFAFFVWGWRNRC